MSLFKSAALFSAALAVATASTAAFASDGLVIHAAEWGVGKFHRYDNKVHAYGNSGWAPYVLANSNDTSKAQVNKNTDGSYTIFFSTLDELIDATTNIADTAKESVSVFNLHGHGLPGAMWFPKDASALNSWACGSWRDAASGSDEGNYSQYYSPVSVSEIQTIRSMSNNTNVHTPCTTGLNEWTAAMQKHPHFKQILAGDAQLHFLSCVVGLGRVGDVFTKGIASLLLPADGKGRVETSMNFGLGDWSMPEGMGFWDLQSADQVERDGQMYQRDKSDREIAQKGTVRAAVATNGQWATTLFANRDYMSLVFETALVGTPMVEVPAVPVSFIMATQVRVPGTAAYLNIETR